MRQPTAVGCCSGSRGAACSPAAPPHSRQRPAAVRQQQRLRRPGHCGAGQGLLAGQHQQPLPGRAPVQAHAAGNAAGEDGGSNGSSPASPPPARRDVYGIPDAALAKQLGLNEALLQSVMQLPGTQNMVDLKTRLVSLADWNNSLRKGVLPKASSLQWPEEPFRSQFLEVLKGLEMARFTRRHPKLLPPLLSQFMQLVSEFEAQLLEEEAQQKQQQQQQQQQQQASKSEGQNPQEQQQQGEGEGQGEGGGEQDQAPDEADMQGSSQQQSDAQGKEGEQQDFDVDLEDAQSSQGERPQDLSDQAGSSTEQLVEKLLEGFKEQWAPVMENIDIAEQAFDDIDGLLEGPQGFDSSSSVWHQTGWREVASLRKKLEDLKELRELVRQLGRGGGKGPLKKAPEQVYNSRSPPGVIRSPMQPEETRGLTRSGDLSRMLPFEAHLLAAGWPRWEAAGEEGGGGGEGGEGGGEGGGGEGERVMTREGSRGARMLFQARRAERMLMSYEREGWVDDERARLTGRLEVRPAAELGPIIVCLDTSGSMYGAREVVAKAVALECMRGAHRQQRPCYLYSFSGPGEVVGLELGTDAASLKNLLTFLTCGFGGGTDVDAPLALSLERVGREEWALADILLCTDGEIPQPSEDILERLAAARQSLGLEVHGLLVGRNVTPPMEALCSHLHVFRSWSVVGGGPDG